MFGKKIKMRLFLLALAVLVAMTPSFICAMEEPVSPPNPNYSRQLPNYHKEFEEVREQKEKEAATKAIEEVTTKIAQNMFALGFADEVISGATQLPLEKIVELRSKHSSQMKMASE